MKTTHNILILKKASNPSCVSFALQKASDKLVATERREFHMAVNFIKKLHNSFRWERLNCSYVLYSLTVACVPHSAEIFLICVYLHQRKFRPIIQCQSNGIKSLSFKGFFIFYVWRHLPTFDPIHVILHLSPDLQKNNLS